MKHVQGSPAPRRIEPPARRTHGGRWQTVTDLLGGNTIVRARFHEWIAAQEVTPPLLDLGAGRQRYGQFLLDERALTVSADRHPFGDIVCDLEAPLPFADGAFRTVLLAHVLNLVLDYSRLISELHRILAPGGAALIWVSFISGVQAHGDYFRYTEEAFTSLLTRQGFTRVKVEPYGGIFTVLSVFASQLCYRLPILPAALNIAGLAADHLLASVAPNGRSKWPVAYGVTAVK